MEVATPLCQYCRNRNDDEPWRCRAFPEEIPQAIIRSQVDHRLPVEGDNGVLFEADSPALAKLVKRVYGEPQPGPIRISEDPQAYRDKRSSHRWRALLRLVQPRRRAANP